MLSTRLHAGVGARAFPSELRAFASTIVNTVAEREIVGLLPHAILHQVPWRVLLRDAGLEWSQLACGVEFGLFLRAATLSADDALSSSCIAFGHGVAGEPPNEIDLQVEAADFAREFGVAQLRPACTRAAVTQAMGGRCIVMLSCHGSIRDRARSSQLALELADGLSWFDDLIPTRVASDLVILSACESGVYEMGSGDFPVGAAPALLRAGARFCIGTRFRVGARFAAGFFPELARGFAANLPLRVAFAEANRIMEGQGADRWRDLACLELTGGP